MDTVTHALSGAVLARAIPRGWLTGRAPGPGTRGWLGAAAAAFPDSDFLIRFFTGPLDYLYLHRGITHSLVLLPAWALLLGMLFHAMTRRRYDWRVLAVLAALSLVIHVTGDLITSYGTRIFAPADWTAHAWPVTFIIDPWFTGILAAGLVLALRRTSHRPAAAALVVLAAYVGFQGVMRAEAMAWGQREAAAARSVQVLPQPLVPFHWKVVADEGAYYRQARLRLWLGGGAGVRGGGFFRRLVSGYRPPGEVRWERIPKFGDEHPGFARRAFRRKEFAPFRRFAGLPFAYRVEPEADPPCAWFTDLRFVLDGMTPPFRYGMCRTEAGWQLREAGRWPDSRPQTGGGWNE